MAATPIDTPYTTPRARFQLALPVGLRMLTPRRIPHAQTTYLDGHHRPAWL